MQSYINLDRHDKTVCTSTPSVHFTLYAHKSTDLDSMVYITLINNILHYDMNSHLARLEIMDPKIS